MANIRYTTEECLDCLHGLTERAFAVAPFETLCTFLRVSFIEGPDWDTLLEAEQAFENFNELLRYAQSKDNKDAAWRLGLLMYCQAVEMSWAHHLLANLLRSRLDRKYQLSPFSDLIKRKKNDPFTYIPPSAKSKFKRIKELAAEAQEQTFVSIIDSLFNDHIRNTFSHSDYMLVGEEYRWREGRHPGSYRLDELNLVIGTCFSFYSALFLCRKIWLTNFAALPRYHKWPNYEVLEILVENDMVYGFSVHFSNGTKATYRRDTAGADACNLMFKKDGTIDFFCGLLDALEPRWKVDGVPVESWDELNAKPRQQ